MSDFIHELEAVVAERDDALARVRQLEHAIASHVENEKRLQAVIASMAPPPDLQDAITEAKYACQKRVGSTAMLSADRLMTLIAASRRLLP